MQTGREERRGGGLGQLCVGTGGGKAGSLEAGSSPSPPPSSQRPASRPGSQDGLTQHPLKEGTSKLLKKAVGMLPLWLCPGQSTEWCFCLP